MVSIVPMDINNDKYIVTAEFDVHDTGGKLDASLKSQVVQSFPLVSTAIRAALATQIIADVATAGFSILATDILWTDTTLI